MQKKILLTGAFGNVGKSALKECLRKDYAVRVFEIDTPKNRQFARKYEGRIEIVWGDLRDPLDIEMAVEGVNVVLHVGAIIPPLADEKPDFAEEVNVEGTRNIVEACLKQERPPHLVYTSSISIYGDRVKTPWITVNDEPNPNDDDYYAQQKLKAEAIVRGSGLEYAIFRLTYIVSTQKLDMDPLMFHMPLATCIEICHTRDVGLALANAVENEAIWGSTYNIAGGPNCRTTYRDYLENMFHIFGLGHESLPEGAFSKGQFHCGFMDTSRSQKFLQYQRHTIDDYYEAVKKKVGFKRYLTMMVKPLARKIIADKSPFLNGNHA